jgi:hypothetical protein
MRLTYAEGEMRLRNKHFFVIIAIAAIALMLLACDTTDLIVALLNPATETPTRTPRPTFTPRPSITPTPEDTPTPEATATPKASATPTRRVVVATPRPPTPRPPTQPPAPQFAWRQSPELGRQGLCPAGPGTFEVKGRIRLNNDYVGGIHIVLLDSTGKVISQMDSTPKEFLNPEWGVSCFEEKNLFSYQLDGSAGRMNQPMTLRLTRSATDLTPISPDIKLTFPSEGGRFYIDWVSP